MNSDFVKITQNRYILKLLNFVYEASTIIDIYQDKTNEISKLLTIM